MRQFPLTVLSVGAVLGCVVASVPAHATAATAARWSFTKPTKLVGTYGASQRAVVIKPNGKRAVELGDDALRVLDITKDPARVIGRNTGIFGTNLVEGRAGTYAYVGNGTSMYVANIAHARPTKVRSYNDAFPGDIKDMLVSPSGKWLYVAFGGWLDPKQGVRIYSLAHPRKPKKVKQLQITDSVDVLAINHKGNRLAVGLGLTGTIQMVDTGHPTHARLLGHPIAMPGDNSPTSAVFSRDGKSLYVVGSDYSYLTRIRVAARSVARNMNYTGRTAGDGGVSVRLSPDGKNLYVLFSGQEDDRTFFVIRRSTMKATAAGTGLLYPTGLAVSHSRPTAGRAYMVTAAYSRPGYFIGVKRVGG